MDGKSLVGGKGFATQFSSASSGRRSSLKRVSSKKLLPLKEEFEEVDYSETILKKDNLRLLAVMTKSVFMFKKGLKKSKSTSSK